MNSRERLYAYWNRDPIDRLAAMPITMMFAADHAGITYKEYAFDHEALVKAQIKTARDFDFDYVSCISDPARETADLGGNIVIYEDQPPSVDDQHALLEDKSTLKRLSFPDLSKDGRMKDRVDAARLLKQEIGQEKIVEGWIEGPCALSADFRGINTLMLDFYDDPDFVRELFDFVIDFETQFAAAQIEAGADLIGIGDAAASLVGPTFYNEFVWPAQMSLVDSVRKLGARIRLHICGKTRKIYEGMGKLNCDIVDLDSMNPMDEARRVMGEDQILLGNISPVATLKNGTPESVYQAIEECHRQSGNRYIVGAGCEVPRGTPHENLRAMIRYALEH